MRKRLRFRPLLKQFAYRVDPGYILSLEITFGFRSRARMLALAVRRACIHAQLQHRERFRAVCGMWSPGLVIQAVQLTAEGGVAGYLDLGDRCPNYQTAWARLRQPTQYLPQAPATCVGRAGFWSKKYYFQRRVYQKPSSRDLPF